MTPTDTSEKELEAIIVRSLVNQAGYTQGDSADYDVDHAVDLAKLIDFLHSTQPEAFEQLTLESECPRRHQFLDRLQGEVAKRGIVDVLRKGINHGPAHLDLFYGTPSPGNPKAAEQFETNIFSVTRQLHYSKDGSQLALDLCIFINGLPVATFELKNRLTKQSVEDAIEQYKRDRNPRELLFQFSRCAVHFAVDDQEVRMCTHLKGKSSWFLPFNKGYNDGAGNPPNPNGIMTDYLWRDVLTKPGLTDILDELCPNGRGERRAHWSQEFQADIFRDITSSMLCISSWRTSGVVVQAHTVFDPALSRKRKSNSIAWLAHQLIGVEQSGKPLFDSIIVCHRSSCSG
jgi:type I restriction enzyme R subunit